MAEGANRQNLAETGRVIDQDSDGEDMLTLAG